MSVPAPSNVEFGTVDPQTGTWEYTDKSIGAGVQVGPNGASVLSRNPTKVTLQDAPQRTILLCKATNLYLPLDTILLYAHPACGHAAEKVHQSYSVVFCCPMSPALPGNTRASLKHHYVH